MFNGIVTVVCASDCPIVLIVEENHYLGGHPDLHGSSSRRWPLTYSFLSLDMRGHKWHFEIHLACNAQKLYLREIKRFSVCTWILYHKQGGRINIAKLPPVDIASSIKSATV